MGCSGSTEAGGQTFTDMAATKPITKAEVEAAIKSWMETFAGLKDEATAEALISKYYAYGSKETLFKPSVGAASTDKAYAVAYFTKQSAIVQLATGPPAYEIKQFINTDGGNAIVYGQWTISLKVVPPPVKEKLDMMKVRVRHTFHSCLSPPRTTDGTRAVSASFLFRVQFGLNEDGVSVTFDYTFGFTRVGSDVKLFLHHNLYTPCPQ